jgi:hypothetical protein
VAQQRYLQGLHRATTRHGSVAAGDEHGSGPSLGVPQGRAAATVQQAGVVYVSDQGDERIQSGEPLGVPGFARGSQSRQRDADDVRETAPRLSPRACHAVAPRDQGAVGYLSRGTVVGESCYPPGERSDICWWSV